MAIFFHCPNCQKEYNVEKELAGRSAKCKCGARLKVPQPEPEPIPPVDDLWGDLDDEYEVEDAEPVATPTPNPYRAALGAREAKEQSVFETSRGTVVLDGLVYTSFVRRLIAAVVDIGICGVIWIVLSLPFMLVIAATKNAWWMLAVFTVCPPAILWYLVYMDCSRWRASLGKQTMSSVCSYVNGEPISLKSNVIRTLAKFGTLLSGGLGFLPVLFTRHHQSLHDIVAGTIVTRSQLGEWDIFRRERRQRRRKG